MIQEEEVLMTLHHSNLQAGIVSRPAFYISQIILMCGMPSRMNGSED